MPRRGAKVTVKFVTQNLRGLKTETRLEELFAYVQRSGVFAACVQETCDLILNNCRMDLASFYALV